VGIPHPVDMTDAERAAWARVLYDYAIAQPFAQIGRAFYVVRDDERGGRRVHRLDDARLPKQAPFVLEAKGWERTDEWDATAFARPLPSSDATARLELAPNEDGFRVVSVQVDAGKLGDLDPIAFSELVGDIERARI
jgi:hypothetical protein